MLQLRWRAMGGGWSGSSVKETGVAKREGAARRWHGGGGGGGGRILHLHHLEPPALDSPVQRGPVRPAPVVHVGPALELLGDRRQVAELRRLPQPPRGVRRRHHVPGPPRLARGQ